MRKILIINKDDDFSIDVSQQVADEFHKYDVECIAEEYMHTEYAEDVELAVVIGGDGSILRARLNIKNNLPILGINTGSVGYLSEIQPPRIPDAVERITKGDYRIENLTQIQAQLKRHKSDLALNDIMLYPIMATSMLRAKVHINGTFISEIQADGIMVATPTGSTAYSLSAGGSVLTNDSNALIVTAIAPYKAFTPIVVNDDSVIELEISRKYNESFVKTDGQIWQMAYPHDKIKIFKGKPKPFIRLGYITFYEKLRGRMK